MERTREKTEWDGGRQDRMRRRQTAQRGRERVGERKRVWSIHKQVVACPSKRPRTLWLYTSSSCLCLPLPTFLPKSRVSISSSPVLHASSRFRDIARGRGVAVHYIARGWGVAVHYVAQGCSVAVRYVARGCGIAVRYVAREYGVAVRYVARRCDVAGYCAVTGAQGYDTIGVARWGRCAIFGRCSVQVHDAAVFA